MCTHPCHPNPSGRAASPPLACAPTLPLSRWSCCLQGAPTLTYLPQVMEQRLSGQRAALERGQNPLPLYLSLNVKENNLETLDFKGTVLSSVHSTLQHPHTLPLHPAMLQRIQTGKSCTDFPAFWKDGNPWAEEPACGTRCPGGGRSGDVVKGLGQEWSAQDPARQRGG